MKCSNCLNYINIIQECNLCQEILCSEECILSHNQIYHQTNIEESHVDNSINNNSFLNYAKIIDDISSPFLVKGIMNYGYILYDPMYSPDNFTLIYSDGIPKIIGNGSFGQVFLAVNNIDQKIYAIKHMEKEKLIKYLNCLDPIYAEIDIQSRVNHQNIVKLLYVRENEVTFDLVMEYAKNGTLFDYVVKNKGLSEKLAFKYFIQIVNAIKFLHDNDVIHRDIKPENILLFDNDVAKLCDFGWSIKCVDRLPGGSFTGTTEYMAPELINNMEYGKEIDIWMLGILLYELMHGFSPFRPKKAKFEDKEVVHNIQTHNINFYMPVSDDCKELIFSLLESDVNKRCTIDDIFNSKFVKNFEKEENDYSSHYDKEDNEKSDRNNNDSITNSNVNNNEAQHENDLMQITKSQLLNRYTENDELNDSKRVISSGKNYQFINIKRIDSDNLSSKISQTENSIINNNKNIVDNSLDIDDPYEDEPNAPKNNKRNRLKNKQNVNSSVAKLNFNFINENALSPVKKKEEENKHTISNSPKNNNKKKNNLDNELNFDLNPNTIINNNLLTSRRYRDKDRDKELFAIGEEQTKRKRSVVLVNNNLNNSQIKNEITNYIFNNNKEINNKEKILGKKLTLNSNPQLLSLSLSPGTAQYTSLLTRSVSPDKPFIHSIDKNDYLMNQNSKNNFPVDGSDNWSNSSQNIREYPFDHFVSNSSLNIRKPIINNKGNKYINIESESEEEIIIKEKEPNDNMRRKNRNKREEMPRDNIKKSKLNKKINPKDNNKKGEDHINDIKSKNKTIYETKTVNSALNEPICLNVLNGVNPITDSIIKKINENNIKSKNTSIRNLSVSTTKNLRSKRKKSDNLEKFFEKKENKGKDKMNKEQINSDLNNGNHSNANLKKDIKVDLSPKIEKLPINSGKHEKPKPLKKIENKNMSFVGKNKNQVILRNNNANKDKEKKQKVTDVKRERKGGSVNKQYINYSKFNKNMNGQKEIKPIKSYRFINEENKLCSQNESVSGNNMNRNTEIIKKDENDNKQKINNDIIKNKEKEIKENINIKINENKEKNKNEKDIEIIKQEEKKEENKTQKIEAKEEKKNISKKEENEKKEKTDDNNSEEYELILKKEENKEEKIKEVEKLEDVEKKDNKIIQEKDEKKQEDEIIGNKNIQTNIEMDNNKALNIQNIKEKSKLEIENNNNNKNDIIKINNNSKDKENIKIEGNQNIKLISKDNNKDTEIKNNHLNKNIKETKENKNKSDNNIENTIKDNKDTISNITSNQKELLVNKRNRKNKSGTGLSIKILSNKNILKSDNNTTNNKKEIKANKEKKIKTEINEKDNQKNIKEKLAIKTIEIENGEKEPNGQIKKIYKKTERKYSREKRYTKVKIAPSKKTEKSKNIKLNVNVESSKASGAKKVLQRKVNTKSSQNEQLTDSSMNEKKIGQNKDENKIKSSYNIRSNNSNSESKTTTYSKNHIYNIKDQIKVFSSIINTEDLNININKSKSPDIKKKFIFKSKLQNKEEFLFKNDITNNNNIHQIKNKIINKNENKENVEMNKRINGQKDVNKNNDKGKDNISVSGQRKDSNKKSKKKCRKFKSGENLKEENEQSEKYNNDSESYIIDGDSEYGDSEIF